MTGRGHGPGERAVLVSAVASQATVSICSWGLGALVPELAAEFALTGPAIGLVLAAGSVSTALALVPAGALVDRVGPRRPLLVGAVGVAACLIAAGYASGLGGLVIAFGAFGLFQAVITLAGAVSILHTFPPARRGTAMGVRQMAVSLGGLLAAVLLPGLAALGGVRLALLTSAALAGASALAFALVSPARGVANGTGAAQRGLALDLTGLLRRPGMVRLLALAAVYVISLAAVLGFAVAGLRADGAGPVAGSALFVVVSLSAMAARLVWGRLADRRGPDGVPRRWSTLRAIWVVLVLGALGYWALSPIGAVALVPAMAVLAFGAFGANGVLQLIAGELAGPERAGQGVGLASMVLFGVSALVSPVHGWVADTFGYRALWLICAGCGLVCLLLTDGTRRVVPSRIGEAPA
ncbi:MAG: MFS transporter [Kineosporiaceae bacterium]|nr:MFS transporter [Kineosporiaceae bacterium]